MTPTRGRVPLFGIVSRLASQKGFDLLTDTLPKLLQNNDVRLAVVGTGRRGLREILRRPRRRSIRGRAWFFGGYDEALAHWIEGASDAFLMPSQYEPCGLNQMYSLRYGTIPIVRRTGGLADSVTHFDPATGAGTGIVFNDFDAIAMHWALDTAMSWYAQPALWERIVQNAMRCDFSWETQANEYLKLFAELLQLDAAALVKRECAAESRWIARRCRPAGSRACPCDAARATGTCASALARFAVICTSNSASPMAGTTNGASVSALRELRVIHLDAVGDALDRQFARVRIQHPHAHQHALRKDVARSASSSRPPTASAPRAWAARAQPANSGSTARAAIEAARRAQVTSRMRQHVRRHEHDALFGHEEALGVLGAIEADARAGWRARSPRR